MYTPNSTAKKKKVQTHRPTLKSDDKELMLSVLIRNPAAFECAASLLTYEDFSDHERGFALAWKVAKDYFAAEGQLPSKTLMLANVRQALGDDPEFLMESERDELDCWLEKAFDAKHWEEDITSSAAHCTWAIKALKRHLTEQNASAAHAVRENGRVVIDVVGFLDDCRLRQEKINALGDACNAPLKLISAAEWHKQQGKLTFLIPGALPEKQCTVIGAPKKGMKTSTAADMAVALATKGCWLGQEQWQATRECKVAYFIGEGSQTLNVQLDVILDKQGLTWKDLGDKLQIVSRVPKLGNDEALAWLEREIKRVGAEVIFLDCLYIMLPGKIGEQAGNMNVTGGELERLTEIAQRTGTTIVLLHHVPKSRGNTFEPLELDDLSHAGVGEWCRAWILLGKRVKYAKGSGLHELWATIGGVRRDKVYALRIDEGSEQNPTWDIDVLTQAETIAAEEHKKEEAQGSKGVLIKMYEQMVLETIAEHTKGINMKNLLAAVKGRRDTLLVTLEKLKVAGKIELCSLKNANGTNSTGYKAVAIAENTSC